MIGSRLKRPSPGTVLGLIALIVAVAGNADAFSQHVIVRKGDIAKGAVTAKALAASAVHTRALAKNAVTAKALATNSVGAQSIQKGAVTGDGLAPSSVTTSAIAPGSVYGAALGPTTTHILPIADVDTVPHNGEWTASSTVVATCAPGERVIDGGVVFTEVGNREVGILESAPFSNGGNSGFVGRITSDSGGSAAAEVQAVCLK